LNSINSAHNTYLPLQLDASKLADAWVNDDYDELKEPLVIALDNLNVHHQLIIDEHKQKCRSVIAK